MGRYDFRPQRVLRTAEQLLETNRISHPPSWHSTISAIPPPQILVRPLQQRKAVRPGTRKSSKMFQPARLRYREDGLRATFFGDHPWELARPAVVLEDGGRDARGWDWRALRQPGRRLDGESVVRRQMWLVDNEGLGVDAAYDRARREFYFFRHREDVERRVAKEEALATGAYFGLGPNEVGMELENRQYEEWKAWAMVQMEKAKQAASAAYTGVSNDEEQTAEEADEQANGLGDASPGRQAALGPGIADAQIGGNAVDSSSSLVNRIPEPATVLR